MLARQGTVCFDPRPCARGDQSRARRASRRCVSIHAPARGATLKRRSPRSLVGFDPRPCARGDAATCATSDHRSIVSIHAPARGATAAAGVMIDALGVSIHAPARGATSASAGRHRSCHAFRSTPLREGRPDSEPSHATASASFDPRPCARGDAGIASRGSIPMFRSTPLREGRLARRRRVRAVAVSIHAPARGATVSAHVACRSSEFRSTPLREGRPRERYPVAPCNVSIHAPARGATLVEQTHSARALVSIHAPARGATRRIARCRDVDRLFRSTPLREGRRA